MGPVDQFKLHIMRPGHLTGIPEFANRTEVGSCDSSDQIWFFENGGLISWLHDCLKVENCAHDVLEAIIV
jgi:hypothetical protein